MHELAIAQAVVDVVVRHAQQRRVAAVALRVGHLRQAVPAALDFAFALAARGTVAEGAELVIAELPAVGRCRLCASETELHEFPFRCSACLGTDLELTQGEELLVESVDLEEEVACTARP